MRETKEESKVINRDWFNYHTCSLLYYIYAVPNLYISNKRQKIAFGNKEHTTDKKMGVSVLLRLFISSNEVCNTAYEEWFNEIECKRTANTANAHT